MNKLADRNFASTTKHIFENLLLSSEYTDVTIACDDDKQIKAHKFVLSESSQFFKSIFAEDPEPNSLLFLHGVRYSELQAILKFVYLGDVDVAEHMLGSFLDTAQYLEIKGLRTIFKSLKVERYKRNHHVKNT
eukprot:TRINITY_DN11303_c0_g1_i1.p1 TRINITY_DN11303_c0_g1~~TRINITY_DN11303_c0_g1_i1.p1  ORF type:complete len:133 (-),score=22.85 TRINITY_DN11303_c0_g1_i1:71-469(-)